MITTAIVYDHRNRTPKGKEGPLEVRLTIDRKVYYIGTGVRVRKNQWQFDRVVDHPQSNELNERLGILLAKIMARVNARIKNGQMMDVQSIRREIWGVVDDASFITWIKHEIDMLGVREGTRKHYVSLTHQLEDFGGMMSWADVTVENIYKWDTFVRQLPGRASEHISGAGVYNYHKCLSAMLSRAERIDLIPVNPYHKMRGVFSKGDKENTEYLTEEEMAKIESFQPAPGTWMERARDLFILQMYTGLSYSDIQAFNIAEYKEINGKWRRIGSRIKTGQPFVSQLLPPVVEVLKRYDWKVPQLTNQVYNRELKAVGMAAGITTRLHSHLARHTFATYMLRHGVPIEHLAKMLGHANIKQTQRYAKVLAESVHEDFDMIDTLLTKRATN